MAPWELTPEVAQAEFHRWARHGTAEAGVHAQAWATIILAQQVAQVNSTLEEIAADVATIMATGQVGRERA